MMGLLVVAYLTAAVLFILSLGGLSRQDTAARGNVYGMVGMAIAVAATALIPASADFAVQFSPALIGSLVVEKIFAIPGLGVHFIEAATQRDYPLAIALELLYTVMLFSANTVVDIAYSVIDPRVKLE